MPHFNREAFEASLLEAGVSYRHYPEMGGRRAPRAGGSVNTGWRVAAFNAFADHMATADFAKALADLEEFASEGDAAVMCSEGLPWKCHRRLIADGLITRGWEVVDVMPDGKERPAALTTFAAVSDGILVYKQT